MPADAGPLGAASWKGQELGLPADGPGSLGGLGRRFVGLFLDGLLFIPVLIVATVLRHPHVVTEVSSTGAHTQKLVEDEQSPAAALAIMVPSAVYVIAMVAWRGQTLGEQAMGLRVIRLIDRQHPGLTPALARWVVLGGPAIAAVLVPRYTGWTSLWSLLVYVWALWDHDRQGLHDKFARVIVVSTR